VTARPSQKSADRQGENEHVKDKDRSGKQGMSELDQTELSPGPEQVLVDYSPSLPDLSNLSFEEIQRLVHKLARQTDELRKAQLDLMLTKDKFRDLCEESEKEIAERKKAEEALSRSESMLRNILATSPVGIGLTENRIIRWANEAWIRMFGFESEQEFTGKSADMLYSSNEEYERVGNKLYENLDTETITAADATFRRKDGSLFCGHIRVKALDPSDLSKGVISAISDISERKRAEEALREAQERVELTLTGADLGWWDWNIPTDEGILNERGLEMLGYLPGEIEPSFALWKKLVHPEDSARVLAALQEHWDGGVPLLETEHRLRTKSGEWKWILGRGKVVERDESGNPLRMAGTFLDIADRKRAEEALRISEQRFRAVFEGAEDFIFIKDRSLRYVDVNPAIERFFGVSSDQIIGSSAEDWIAIEDSHRIRETDERVLKGESVQEEHSRLVNEIPLFLLTTKVPLRNDAGEIVGILGISRDITDRKIIEPSPGTAGEYPSRAMKAIFMKANSAAQGDVTVLLTGESGSGKDYIARYVHEQSNRVNGPYFSVNCAAIAAELAESELFGHEKGAFTGAVTRKRGMLELAEGGTLLLNEIGELSLPIQAKLLTFLDTRKFTRVGGEKEISVNVRLIAATNRDLEREVRDGCFRQDLFYRLNVIRIEIPPLRQREDDIPVLVQQLLTTLRIDLQFHDPPVLDPAAMSALMRYSWPGNVRELRNVLERALILSRGKVVNLASLGFTDRRGFAEQEQKACFSVSFPGDRSLNQMTQELKRFLVAEALRISQGSKQGAARLLGISRYSLKHYIKTLGLGVAEEED
jgi:PAS domain S-box-containing protein